jgi:hypothetical protein
METTVSIDFQQFKDNWGLCTTRTRSGTEFGVRRLGTGHDISEIYRTRMCAVWLLASKLPTEGFY